MSVLFCDTDCELWYTRARELDLKVIGMPYTIDGEEKIYDLGEHTDFTDFFTRMKNGAAAITSGLNEQTYVELFEPYFKASEDILYIAFSSKMSSTFKYCDAAVKKLSSKYPGVRFLRFDTLNISMGAGLLVYLGANFFRAHGGDIDKTYAYLESVVQNVCVLFVVDDLKYLARGGRISPSKAKIGNIMQIKPVLSIDKNGEIDVYAKQNGSKKALTFVLNEIKRKYKPVDGAPIVIVNAICGDISDAVEAKIREMLPGAEIWSQPIGPVIGAHCGPGAYGVIFPSTER